MIVKSKLVIGVSLVAWAACTGCHRRVSGKELTAYIADPGHGLTQQVQRRDMRIVVQYLPTAYQLWQDIREGAKYSPRQAEDARKEYDHFYYFRMMVRNAPRQKALDSYYNFGIKENLSLVSLDDTVPCSICQRIVNGNSSLREYLLAFPRNAKANGSSSYAHGFQLLYTGDTLGLSAVSFNFKRSKLNKIPALKFDR
jgi:hypothetical protein